MGSALQQKDAYSKRLLTILRYGGIIAPIATTLYGFFIFSGFIESTRYYSDNAYILISIAFLVIGLLQFVDDPKKPATVTQIATYHLLLASFLLFVSGFQSPLIVGWVVLLVVASLYYDRRALGWSLIGLLLVGVVDAAIWLPVDNTVLVGNLATFAIVSFISITIIYIIRAQLAEHGAYRRIRAKESLQRDRMTTLINSVSDGIINTDSSGTVQVYNAATLGILDTNESIAGRRFDDILELRTEDGKRVRFDSIIKNAKRNPVRDDLTHTFGSDETIRISLNCASVQGTYGENASKKGYIFIIRDITKEKSLEQERDEFISIVSHELRTPIAIAEGAVSNAQLMLDKGAKPAKLVGALSQTHEQVLYLSNLINDLSTLSRAERGVSVEPEDVAIEELIHEMYRQYQPAASAKKLHFNIDISPQIGTLHTSRLYLEEILQNLITNAIKYTQNGNITLKAIRVENGIYFEVADTGIGISKSDKAKIFKKFFRSEDYRTRETNGTGLGLYVVSKLSEKLHTTVELSSRLNNGSTFSFTISDIKK